MAQYIKLVNELCIDIDNIPEDFSEQVKAEFEKFTELTAKDYRYEDKLSFIDLCAMSLHGDEGDYDIVKRLIHERTDFGIDTYGELPDTDDYNAIEFMENCVREGREMSRLHFNGNEGKIGNKKMRVLDLIISALYSQVDVSPVVHGHWIETQDDICFKNECSACHSMVRVCIGKCIEENDKANFCPICGARMDGDKK